NLKVALYLMRKKLSREDKFPLVVEIEPLFACNLECPGCGKIQHPTEILRRRLSVEQVIGAVEECGAPVVSIAGGEPLLHPDIDRMVRELVARKRFVYLCTNAVLLRRKLELFGARLAEAVLSDERRIHVHVSGTRRDHRMGALRSRARPALRQLHGSLRV